MAARTDEGKAKETVKMLEAMKSTRSNWDTTWRDVALFIIPNKDDVFTHQTKSKGEEKHERLTDGSAEHFNELLASALHSMLTNPSTQWFELSSGDREIDKKPEVKEWLQELVRKIHQLLNNSNFQSEIHEIYLDLGAFGTAVLRIDEDDETVFHFRSRPIYEIYIRENFKGIVDTVATSDMMPVRVAFQKYGKKTFGKDAEELAKKPDDDIEIVHVVMPRDPEEKSSQFNKPFVSRHVYVKGEILLKEEGFNEFPYTTPRWIKNSGEVYGRSPGMKALPDVRMMNTMMRTTIRGAQKVVDPPLLVEDDGVMGRVNMRPGGLTATRPGGGTKGDAIRPLQTGGQIGLGLELIDDVRNRVKQAFFVDQFQLRDGPQMTATEVNTRDDDRIRLLGPILGRQHFELLQPLIARIIGIMKRKGLLPKKVPAELKGKSPEVFFTSQIARAQRIAEAQNVNRFVAAIAPMVEADPTALDNIDPDKFVRFNGEIYGVPEEIFRKPQEIKALREARAQAQAKQQSAEENLTNSEVLRNSKDSLQLVPGE